MTVEFCKQAPAAGQDAIVCLRADGTRTEAPLARQGVLPLEAIRYVVESNLGWSDGLFAAIAGGAEYPALLAGRRGPGRVATAHIRAGTALAECLAATQWAGAGAAVDFNAALAAACRRRRVAAPTVSAADLARLRDALRTFGAAWRPLPPGQVLRRTFAP
jgi:hypothetical protein